MSAPTKPGTAARAAAVTTRVRAVFVEISGSAETAAVALDLLGRLLSQLPPPPARGTRKKRAPRP